MSSGEGVVFLLFVRSVRVQTKGPQPLTLTPRVSCWSLRSHAQVPGPLAQVAGPLAQVTRNTQRRIWTAPVRLATAPVAHRDRWYVATADTLYELG